MLSVVAHLYPCHFIITFVVLLANIGLDLKGLPGKKTFCFILPECKCTEEKVFSNIDTHLVCIV